MTRLTRRGQPDRRYGSQGPQPHRWITGPDPIRHRIYRWWLVHRSQAHYRGEDYELTFDQFEAWWRVNHRYRRRGRRSDSVIMARRDTRAAWTVDNIQLRPRHQWCTHRGGRPR